jgi:hypothetical protein
MPGVCGSEDRSVSKSSTTPSARTLKECRARGWDAQVVEQTIPRTFIKRDLFGVIDIVAITPGGLLGIQATGGSGGAHAARRAKILAEPRALRWLQAGAGLEIWSYAKQGKAGARKLWALRVEAIEAGHFGAVTGATAAPLTASEQGA